MKAKGLGILLLLSVLSLRAEDSPTLDLFAGWSWYPYAYGYPYSPYRSWWRDDDYSSGPYLGASRIWPYAGNPWPYRYGYAPYPYWGWGYDTGIRLKLSPGNPARLPGPNDALLGPLPGSAPTSLKDETREKAWDLAIESFLSTLPTASDRSAATNAPASR